MEGDITKDRSRDISIASERPLAELSLGSHGQALKGHEFTQPSQLRWCRESLRKLYWQSYQSLSRLVAARYTTSIVHISLIVKTVRFTQENSIQYPQCLKLNTLFTQPGPHAAGAAPSAVAAPAAASPATATRSPAASPAAPFPPPAPAPPSFPLRLS